MSEDLVADEGACGALEGLEVAKLLEDTLLRGEILVAEADAETGKKRYYQIVQYILRVEFSDLPMLFALFQPPLGQLVSS